jgi:hypothetical protein
MRMRLISLFLLAAALCAGAAQADPMTLEQFKEELVGVPLCGTPPTGPFSGKTLCAVHLPDNTVVVAGAGIIIRGIWEFDDGRICRRTANDPMERRRCVDYERISEGHYKNSDGVEFCLGPCRMAAEAKAPVTEAKAPVPEVKPAAGEAKPPATEAKPAVSEPKTPAAEGRPQ